MASETVVYYNIV